MQLRPASFLLAAKALLVWMVPAAVVAGAEPHIIRVEKVWDQASHNAFTDLVRFDDRWFCVFREGSAHVSPDGSLRVITSSDGWHWKSSAQITRSDADLRDAKLTVTPDGRLMLSGAAALQPPAKYKHQSMVWFSDDGESWSEGTPIGDPDHWLWRTTWFDGDAYSIGYRTNSETDRYVHLYRSDNGRDFELYVPRLFMAGYPNEASLVFGDDGTCHCLLRRDGQDSSGQLGSARSPFTDYWSWKDLKTRIGGPHMIQLPDGRFVAAVRLYDEATRTALCWVDVEQGTIEEFLKLPSGGDTSYAGMVWHEGHLWVSYYSGHRPQREGVQTAIYIAKVGL